MFLRDKERIHIRGYINGNLGDDLFVRTLCNRYSNKKFLMVGPCKYSNNFKDISNLKYIKCDVFMVKCVFKGVNTLGKMLNLQMKYWRFYDFLVLFFSKVCKNNIIISGSCFIEWCDDIEYWNYYWQIEKRYYESKPIVIGVNFGPYKTKRYFEKYKSLLKNATYLCVREQYTYNLLEDIHPVYAPDILFNFDENIAPMAKSSIRIVLVVRYCNNEDYFEKLKSIIDKANSCHYEVCLISFCNSEGDDQLIDKLIDNFNKDTFTILRYGKNDYKEILGVIKSADLLLASRFHAMILGWIYNVPTITVSYSKKIENVICDLNNESIFFPIEEIKLLSEELIVTYRICPNMELLKIQKEANKHFDYTDKLFG